MPVSTGRIGPTVLASGVPGTETEILAGGFQIPAGVTYLQAVRVIANTTVYTAAEPVVCQVRLHSTDVKIEPCTLLTEPIGANTTPASAHREYARWWPLNVPVKSGDVIYAAATNVWAGLTIAVLPFVGVTFKFGTQPFIDTAAQVNGKQKFYQVGTGTATGTAAATVTGTPYRISASRITAAFSFSGSTAGTAGTAEEIGYFELSSPDFKTPYGINFVMEGATPALATGEVPMKLNFCDGLDVPCSISGTTITDRITFSSAPIQGVWMTGVQFEA